MTYSILVAMSSVFLLVGAFELPYGYYWFLRVLVFATAVFGAFNAMEREEPNWAWPLGIVAILFNPLLPVHLTKATWCLINPGIVAILMVSAFRFSRRKHEADPDYQGTMSEARSAPQRPDSESSPQFQSPREPEETMPLEYSKESRGAGTVGLIGDGIEEDSGQIDPYEGYEPFWVRESNQSKAGSDQPPRQIEQEPPKPRSAPPDTGDSGAVERISRILQAEAPDYLDESELRYWIWYPGLAEALGPVHVLLLYHLAEPLRELTGQIYDCEVQKWFSVLDHPVLSDLDGY